MKTVAARKGYEITRTPGVTSLRVVENKGAWPAICGVSSVMGGLLAWFCSSVTGSTGVGIVVATVFVAPFLIWWAIVWMRTPGPLSVHMTADSLIVRGKRYARLDVGRIFVVTPGSATAYGIGAAGMLDAAAQNRLMQVGRAQRFGVTLQYGTEVIAVSSRLTSTVAEAIGREIATWHESPAPDQPPLSAAELAQLTAADTSAKAKNPGLMLMAASVIGWSAAMLAYAPKDLAEGILGLAIWPLLGPLMLMGAKRDTHGVVFPPDALYMAAGIIFWAGIFLLIRGAWRSRRRRTANA